MGKLVKNYDVMKAPAILVPSVGHTRTKDGLGIVSRSSINPKTGKLFTYARDL
jgi:RHS family protein